METVAPMAKPVTHDVTITTTKKVARARVMGVPPEEFGIERNARSIRECNYCFHEITNKTEADLIAEGFDEDQVKALEPYRGDTTPEQSSRNSIIESAGGSDTNTAARLLKLTEHYVRMDYENKGKPCLYQVITGGDQGEIMRRDGVECIEPWDVMPFASTCPVPITHRFFGMSIADLVMDIQKIKTALMRGMLDNLYLHNNPRVEVAESYASANTLDDLLVSRAGGIVRTKNPGGLNFQVVPDITGSIYPALGYMDSVREMRSGVTKQGQGVDANALQNQSATAVNQVFTASQARMKLIARIMAEGVRDIFSLLHGTIRKHGGQGETVRLRNSWVNVDPRNWKTRNDMTINVGLGNGGKGEQFAQTMALANFQKELVLGGKTNIVDDAKLFNTAAELAKIMGHKAPDKFFNDPAAKDPQTGQPRYPAPQPPPNPDMIKAQTEAEKAKADVQLKQADMQQRGQELQVKAQLDQQADERKAQIETVQAQADMATQREKTQAEMVMAQQKFELEKQLKLLDHELKREQHAADMQMRREQHEQALQSGAFKLHAGAEAHSQKMEQSKGAE